MLYHRHLPIVQPDADDVARFNAHMAQRQAEGEGGDAFYFSGRISDGSLDSYYTRMMESTLRNFASGAAAGVQLLDSHVTRNLGYGRSVGGQFDGARALADFRVARGIKYGSALTFASTDDFIRAVETESVQDLSVGFGGGRYTCDICGSPYYGRDACQHYAGVEYTITDEAGNERTQVCTVAIHDGELYEVSVVYAGANENAVILKARHAAEAGKLERKQIAQLEEQYRVHLPGGARHFAVGQLGNWSLSASEWANTNSIYVIGDANGARTLVPTPETQPAAERAAPDHEETDHMDLLNEVRAIAEGAGVDAATPETDGEDAVLLLVGRLRDRVHELSPLADAGRSYREDLITAALASGVRAQGESFPQETYRQMLASAGIDEIKAIRDAFEAAVREQLPAGRQTKGEREGGTPAAPVQARENSVVPDDAYKA